MRKFKQKIIAHLIVGLCIVARICCLPVSSENEDEEQGNFDIQEALCAPVIRENLLLFVDQLLDQFRGSIPEVLPLPDIPDKTITLYRGTLEGLPTIYRRGGAEIICKDNVVRFKIELGLKGAEAYYYWRTTSDNILAMDGNLLMYVRDLGCVLEVEHHFQNESYTALKRLEIVALKGAKVTIRGLGPVTWLLSQMATAAMSVFESKISDELETIVQRLICNELKRMFPHLSTRDSICVKYV